jgi:low temperature requirement protein LtrA
MRSLVRAPQLRFVAGADPGRKVTWLELFFDLIFVAAVAQVGEPLGDDYTLSGLIRYSTLFILIWWAWLGNSVFATRFNSDDVLQRVLTLVQMFAVAAMAANAGDALDSRSSAGFAAAYAVIRLVLVAQYWRARQVDCARGLATRYLAGHGVAAVFWLLSAFVPAPARFVIWAVALAIDLGTPWLAVAHSVQVPPDAAHLPERFGLFTLILLGESIIAVMHGMKSQEDWSVAAGSSAFLGMAIAFLLWWWYFDGATAAAEQHVRTRADAIRFHVLSYAHLPLYLGIAAAGAGIERVVHLGTASALHGHDGLILAGALAVSMLSLTLIAAVGARRRSEPRGLAAHLLVTCAVIGGGLASTHWRPVGLVVFLALACAAHVALSLRACPKASVRCVTGRHLPHPSERPASTPTQQPIR